ncbi:MAG: 4-hydroxybenzoate octaprenyltransferase [Alphaproteobacteria bacterium]
MKSPYLRLARLHQPAGILLLLWPCWWAIALASGGMPPLDVLALFGIGAVLMRGAGCIINDIADRKFDGLVERTKTRPLASGELSLTQAVMFLALLLAISLGIAIMLGDHLVLWAALSIIPVAIYPWMKRISWWPQLFLGLTFNWGALMGWVAVRDVIELPALLLYAGGVFWTLGYDTIYAHQDKKDDAMIGIKSTALRLGDNTLAITRVFYLMAILLWGFSGYLSSSGAFFFIFLWLALCHFIWQIQSVDINTSLSCRRIFISNAYQLGTIVFLGALLS